MKAKEKAKVIPLKPENEAEKFYYKLRVDSELGKKFLDIINQGVAADKAADKFAKSLGTKLYIQSMYADFGGIQAFILPIEPEPNPDLWKKVDNIPHNPKQAVYWFNVDVSLNVCLFEELEKVPDDIDNIKGHKKYSYQDLLGTIKMKDIAAAAGIEMKYTDPVVFLSYLKFSEQEIKKYQSGKLSITRMIGSKFLASKRDKQMAVMAIKADEEKKSVLKHIRDKEFGIYNHITGTDEAIKAYNDASKLPVIPAGTLNSLFQIQSTRRIGFARLNEWFYIITTAQAGIEINENFLSTTADNWEGVVAQIKESQKKETK